jgi:ketosteroid isomerase-like protein
VIRAALVIAAALLVPNAVHAQSDSAQVVGTLSRFHAALASGDSIGALALLAPDAVVLEAGAMETRSEYHTHHLGADIEFARAVPSVRTLKQVTVKGDVAWVVSTSETKGTFKDRAINSTGAELVVLTKRGARWMISGIHWSSRSRRS